MADDRPAVGELSVPRASLEDGSNHTLHIRLDSEDTPRVPEVDVHEADDGVRRCASEGGIDLDRSGRDLGKVFDDIRIGAIGRRSHLPTADSVATTVMPSTVCVLVLSR